MRVQKVEPSMSPEKTTGPIYLKFFIENAQPKSQTEDVASHIYQD